MRLVEPRSRIRVADLGAFLDAAVAGKGVAQLPDWLIDDAFGTGRPLHLLPGLPARYHDITLLWLTAVVVPTRMQVAIRALADAGMSVQGPTAQGI